MEKLNIKRILCKGGKRIFFNSNKPHGGEKSFKGKENIRRSREEMYKPLPDSVTIKTVVKSMDLDSSPSNIGQATKLRYEPFQRLRTTLRANSVSEDSLIMLTMPLIVLKEITLHADDQEWQHPDLPVKEKKWNLNYTETETLKKEKR